MKTRIKNTIIAMTLLSLLYSCGQNEIDPSLTLDEVFIPEGYHQVDDPSSAALARLEELRLEHPSDQFFYLKRDETTLMEKEWIFPQKELKIEFVDYDEHANSITNAAVQGVIVKKIRGNWDEEVFMIVEGKPAPKGGMKELYAYISSNIQYPEAAKKAGIEGKVFVEFVVDQQGKLTDVKAIKGIGHGCDEEAVRVVKESANWIPGLVGGKAGKVRMILPISYRLN